jgi:hypothetical protein
MEEEDRASSDAVIAAADPSRGGDPIRNKPYSTVGGAEA